MTNANSDNNKIPTELTAAIRKAAIEQVAKWTIAALVFLVLVALSGWWLYFKDKLINIVGVPVGAVLAFDNRQDCADFGYGWQEFSAAKGRVILGAGKGADLTDRPFGTSFGKEQYRLTPENLPPHRHNVYRHAGEMVGKTGVPGAGGSDPVVESQVRQNETGAGPGKSEPYDVMPPYIALYYCKKVR